MLVTGRGADGAVVAVHAVTLCWAASDRHLLVHHNVQHTRGTLGIVLCTRVGHHLNALHGRGGHALEHHRRVRGEHHVGHAVDIHFERRRAVHRDIVLTVDRYHRHLAEHVEHGVRLRVLVFSHVVTHLVDLHLHQRLLGDHLHALQHGGVLLNINSTEVEFVLIAQVDGLADILLTHAAEHDIELTLAVHLLRELSVLLGEEHGDGLVRLASLEHADGGKGLCLA